jgi:hypothetical protein
VFLPLSYHLRVRGGTFITCGPHMQWTLLHMLPFLRQIRMLSTCPLLPARIFSVFVPLSDNTVTYHDQL